MAYLKMCGLRAGAVLPATSAQAAEVSDRAAMARARPAEQIVASGLPAAHRDAMLKPVEAFYGFWNNGSPALLAAALAPDFTDHTLPPGRSEGVAGPAAAAKAFVAAVPDLRCKVVQRLVVGDRVVSHLRFTGHFTGRFMGSTGTGQAVDFIATDILRVLNGRVPAIAEHVEEEEYETVTGVRRIRRLAGEALHPEREPLETLEQIRATIGEYNFASQYQQSPAPLEGGMVKRAWFKVCDAAQLPERFDTVLQSWDTANKPSELSDYSVCTTWGLASSRIYLLHVLRKKLDYPSLKRAVREQAQLHAASVVLIEDKASGTQLIQELADEGMRSVTRYTPEAGSNKQMRLHAQCGVIENGLVHLPAQAEWLDAYLHEITTFPSSRHDDQVDSTSQALHWIKTGLREPAILTYYRRMLEAQLAAEAGSG